MLSFKVPPRQESGIGTIVISSRNSLEDLLHTHLCGWVSILTKFSEWSEVGDVADLLARFIVCVA